MKATSRINSDTTHQGIDRIRSLDQAMTRFSRTPAGKGVDLSSIRTRLDSDNNISQQDLSALEQEFKALRTTAALITAEEADSRHWLIRVRQVLKLAAGKGQIKVASEENGVVTILMRPMLYLDPTIMLKLIMIFKAEKLAMVIKAKSPNTIAIQVGDEATLESQSGATV